MIHIKNDTVENTLFVPQVNHPGPKDSLHLDNFC